MSPKTKKIKKKFKNRKIPGNIKKNKAVAIKSTAPVKNRPVKTTNYANIDPDNPILLRLEDLFALLSKGAYKISYILKYLNIHPKHTRYLDNILDILTKYTLLKTMSGVVYKLNIKHIKDTKIPRYFLLKIISQNSLGEYIASYPPFIHNTSKYTIVIDKTTCALQPNSYVLAKLSKISNSIIKASILTIFPKYVPEFVTGLVNIIDNNYFLFPLGRKYKFNFPILHYDGIKTLRTNALIRGEVVKGAYRDSSVTNIKVISDTDLTHNLSLLTVYEFGLNPDFSEDIIQEINRVNPLPDLSGYTDLTELPLVTIDGEDAKDFDDAVVVIPISQEPLKYKAIVAIADVSSYVRSGSLLDTEALKRGNSTYLPGLVVPMLPNILSNNWCSLRPGEVRSVLAVDLIINDNGIVEDYNFYKAIIKSHARLTYTEVEDAIHNKLTPKTAPLFDSVIQPLYECWKLLHKTTINRNALTIHSNEYKVVFNEDNSVQTIEKRQELTAHKIIEEFMIAANVAAAQFLRHNNLSNLTIYRIHDKPSSLKLEYFTSVLKAFSIPVKIPAHLTPKFFNNLLSKYANSNIESMLNEAILASQSQAEYSTNNIGHFGLALKEYCHFTSPIRRYADLIIHRLITSVLNKTHVNLDQIEQEQEANYISSTERNSSHAEYAALEKITTKLLSTKLNSVFEAAIVNMTNAGLFVAIDAYNAQGLIPMRSLGNDRFVFSKNKDKLIGLKTKQSYQIGQTLKVVLTEANILKGLLTFSLETNNK